MRGGRILASGLFDHGRLAVIDTTGVTAAFVGETPWDGDSASAFITQQAFSGVLKPDEHRSRVALALRYADQIEIFDSVGVPTRTFTGPFAFRPTYHIGRRGKGLDINFRDDTRFGYVWVDANDAGLVALFSGRILGAARRRSNFGRFVHDIAWDGTLRHVYRLDRDAVALAIAQDGRTLFALCPDENGRPSSDVVSYRLP
jgi:hypothetical protein